MFKCVFCKKEFTGEPAMRNGSGAYCEECKAELVRRMCVGNQARRENFDGCCLWCGEKLTSANIQPGKDNPGVCRSCDTHRDWLLACIRHSDKPAKYVSRVEAKEGILREARNAEKKQSATQNIDTGKEALTRLTRLENIIGKLASEFGISE